MHRFVRLKVLSHVARQRFSPHDAPLSSIGSQRDQFSDVVSTMRALRLPTHASPVTYLFRFRGPRVPPRFVFAVTSAPGRMEAPIGPGPLFSRRSYLPARSRVDVSGTSQVLRRPILCLCPGPRPRPNRRSLATDGLVDAAPAAVKTKASALLISGLLRGFSTCCLRFKDGVATATCKTRFRLAGWPLPGGS